jgi:hypothetical protein
MKNLIQKNRLYLIFICLFLNSCIADKYDVYEKVPKDSLIDIDLIRESESIFKTDFGIVLMYNLKEKGDDEYNPHLLFFDKNSKLTSACYFLSENIYNYNENVIYSYLNDYRKQRESRFRSDIPVGIDIKYIKYSFSEPSSRYIDVGTLNNIKYDKNNNSVNFSLKNTNSKESKYENIPLYKLTYNYKEEEIIINDTYNNEDRVFQVFKVKKELLDTFFKELL